MRKTIAIMAATLCMSLGAQSQTFLDHLQKDDKGGSVSVKQSDDISKLVNGGKKEANSPQEQRQESTPARQDSLQFGPFWFMDASLFSNQSLFDQHLRILRRDLQHSNEDYITEHWQRYDSPDMPPSWKTLEVTTFGLLSRLYSNFADPTAKHVVA